MTIAAPKDGGQAIQLKDGEVPPLGYVILRSEVSLPELVCDREKVREELKRSRFERTARIIKSKLP